MGLFDLFKSKKNDDEEIEEAYNCTDDEDNRQVKRDVVRG